MSATKYFYLRKDGTRQSEIVGCCAYRRIDNTIEYAVSAINLQHDRFERDVARKIARERLNRKSQHVVPTVADTFWNRMKMKVGVVKQSYEPQGNRFEVRTIIEMQPGDKPYVRLLNDIARRDATDLPTNLRKAAKRMLRVGAAEKKRMDAVAAEEMVDLQKANQLLKILEPNASSALAQRK